MNLIIYQDFKTEAAIETAAANHLDAQRQAEVLVRPISCRLLFNLQ